MRVSGNRDWAILLKAVGLHVRGVDVVYKAKSLLSNVRTPTMRAYNKGVTDMAAALLEIPETDPDLIERVLRSLPEE